MDLAQLRAFVTTVDEGGVGRAAVRLHISQPALSRQLQSLEDELGLLLFTREHRRLSLTAEGEELVRRARNILSDAQSLKELAHAFQAGDVGVIRLGATPPMIESPLAPFLGRWQKRHANIEIRLVEDGGSSLAERLDRDDVQVAYVPAGDARFEYRPLYPVHVVAAFVAGHKLSRSPSVELAEIVKLRLVALNPGFGSRDWFDAACRDAHLRPTVAMESASHSAVLALAASEYGVGILPSAVVPPVGVDLVPIVLDGVPVGRWTMIAWSKRRYQPPYVMTFIDEFVDFARRHYPGRSLLKRAPQIVPQFGSIDQGTFTSASVRRSGRRRTTA